MSFETVPDNNENATNTQIQEKDSTAEQERILKKQIEELKSVIIQAERNLGITKFGNIKDTFRSEPTNLSSVKKIPDLNIKIKNELYRYAGFYCTKFTKKEYVFEFFSSHKCREEDKYLVQIINENDKGKLGKWIMPLSVDMDDLLSQTQLDDLRNVPQFLRNCKHQIDCYSVRLQQFNGLKDGISHIKNCNVYSNIGYTQINLELSGVHDIKNDVYLNLNIYLMYRSDTARPYRIQIENENLNDNTIKLLRSSMKYFKSLDLRKAFEKMLIADDDSLFVWTREIGNDSPINLNNTSSSDEEDFLTTIKLQKEKTLVTRKRRRKVEEKWKKRKKQTATYNLSKIQNADHNNRENIIINAENVLNQSSDKKASKNRSTNNTATGSRSVKRMAINDETHEDSIPLSLRINKSKNKLKRMKLTLNTVQSAAPASKKKTNPKDDTTPLSLRINRSKDSSKQTKLNFDIAHSPAFSARNKNPVSAIKPLRSILKENKKIGKLLTSTPLNKGMSNPDVFITSNASDISNITVNEGNRKSKNKVVIDQS